MKGKVYVLKYSMFVFCISAHHIHPYFTLQHHADTVDLAGPVSLSTKIYIVCVRRLNTPFFPHFPIFSQYDGVPADG